MVLSFDELWLGDRDTSRWSVIVTKSAFDLRSELRHQAGQQADFVTDVILPAVISRQWHYLVFADGVLGRQAGVMPPTAIPADDRAWPSSRWRCENWLP